jgi:hypothetical protein
MSNVRIIRMKTKMPVIIIIISSIILVLVALLTNKIQRACVDIGKIGPGELTKISYSISEIDRDQPIKLTMVESHATAGSILLLSMANFTLLSGTILLSLKNKKS